MEAIRKVKDNAVDRGMKRCFPMPKLPRRRMMLDDLYQGEGGHSPKIKKVDLEIPINYKLGVQELPEDGLILNPGQESPAPRPDKIFRLRTGPEKKVDASRDEARLIYSEFVITQPADEAHDSEDDALFEVKFDYCFSVKLFLLNVYIGEILYLS